MTLALPAAAGRRGDRARNGADNGGIAGSGALVRRRPSARTSIAIAAFGAFLAFVDSTVVNVAFPSLLAAFPHAGIGGLSWVLNAYNVVFAGVLVLAGRFADLLGRRRLFMWGLAVFVVTSAACAAATSIGMLVAFRLLQGAGAAMLVPASLGIVIHSSTPERRARSLSVWAAAAALAAGLGPPLGGALVDAYNWRLVFVINVPFGVLAWVLARRKVVESREPGRRTIPDVRGALLLSLALGAVTFGVVQGPAWGWSSAGVVASFAVAVACGAGVLASSRRHASPILDPALLRIRGFFVSNLVVLLAGLGLYTYLLTHILWLHLVWGYSLVVAGLSVAPGAVVTMLTAEMFGRLADRFGPRAVVVPGALVWAGAFVWYTTRVGLHPDFLGAWLPGQVISGIGVAATLPVATSGGLAAVPSGRYATASAVSSSARQVGGVLGIAVLTTFIAHVTPTSLPADLRHGWDLAIGSFALAAVVATFFGHVRAHVDASAVGGIPIPVSLSPGAGPLAASRGAETEHGLLDHLPPEVRDAFLSGGERIVLHAGDVLFHAGDPGGTLYAVESGRLEVHLPGGAIRELGIGAVVGELAVLTGAPRSASVVARRDAALISVRGERFEELLAERPDAATAVARALARMLQEDRPRASLSAPPPRVVAVVALDDAAPVAEVADALSASLRQPARCRDEVGGDTPPEDASGQSAHPVGLRVVQLAVQGASLDAAERSADRVVISAGPGGPWHDACLRQADRVVLVSGGTRPAFPDPPAAPIDVVVVDRVTESDVAAWQDATGCRRVYVAGDAGRSRADGALDVALRPLADRIAGRSVAVALGSGGARALAGLGVLAALEDAGVRVDRVSGVSIGALIAATFATGIGAQEVEARLFDELVQRHPFSDYRLSFASLSRGARLRAMLERCLADSHIEAMPRELVVASTNLADGTTVYHRRGRAATAVAASMAMPVLLAPRRIDGRVLVDGSLSVGAPVECFAEHPEGPVVAVQIAPPALSETAGRVPSLGETLVQVMAIGARGAVRPYGVATVTVTPSMDEVGMLEFHQIDVAIAAGRRAGEAAVAALAASEHADQETDGALDGP